MADSKRDTKRERRDEAKKRRLEEIRRRQRKARMRKVMSLAVVALAIVGLGAGIFVARASSNRKKADLAAAARQGGCTSVKSFSNEGQNHVTPPAKVDYKTNPPTSGNHYPSPANTGFPSPTPPDEALVHNMEHGHVIFWFKPDLDPALLTQLQDIVKKDPTRLILVPRDNMDAKLVFTAWRHMQSCPTPTTATAIVAEKFADVYKKHGAEGTGDTPGIPQGV